MFGRRDSLYKEEERKDLISVIVPIYNVEKYVERCLLSIIEQTYENLEIICVNDCTQDDSMKIVEELQKKDSRIIIVNHKENKGLGEARNTGIKLAKGEYISFVDSDDYISPLMIENLYNAIIATDSEMAQCKYIRVEDKNNFIGNPSPSFFINKGEIKTFINRKMYKLIDNKKVCPSVCNKLFKKEIILENNISFKDKFVEDVLFTLTYVLKAKKVCLIPFVGYYYYINKNSLTKTVDLDSNVKKMTEYFYTLKNIYSFYKNIFSIKTKFKIRKYISSSFNYTLNQMGNLQSYPDKFYFIEQEFYCLASKNNKIIEKLVPNWMRYVKDFYYKNGFSSYDNFKNKFKIDNKLNHKLLNYIKTLYQKIIFNLFYKKKHSPLLLCEYIPNMFKSLEKELISRKIKYTKVNTLKLEHTGSLNKLNHLIKRHRVIITDTSFSQFKKRKSFQKLVVSWHASGLFKLFGMYEPKSQKHWINWAGYPDYCLVSSKHLISTYAKIFGINKSKVLALGTPRTDSILDKNSIKEEKFKFFSRYPYLKGKKIYLFAPTFRSNWTLFLNLDFSSLHEQLSNDEIFIIKQHPSVVNQKIREKHTNLNFYSNKILNMDYEDIHLLTIVCDVFITDFSSGIFDAILLNKPLVFYAEDVDNYLSTRGLFFDYKSEIPGEIVCNADSKILIKAIRSASSDNIKYQNFKEKNLEACKGDSAKKIINFIETL